MEVKPRQKILDKQEDAFLFARAKMLLYECLRIERMLSPHTIQFYPAIDALHLVTKIEE